MNRIALERFGKPWLANDVIFEFTPLGRQHNRLLKIVHGFAENVNSCSRVFELLLIFPKFIFSFKQVINKRKEGAMAKTTLQSKLIQLKKLHVI